MSDRRNSAATLARVILAAAILVAGLAPLAITPTTVVAQFGYHVGSGTEFDIGPSNWPIAYGAGFDNPGNETLHGLVFVVTGLSGNWRATSFTVSGYTSAIATGMSVDVGGNGSFCFDRTPGACAAVGYSATALTGSGWSADGGACSPTWGCDGFSAGVNRTSGTGGHVAIYPIYPGNPTPPTEVYGSGNLLENTDFNIAPQQPGAAWADVNRVVQMPVGSLDPVPLQNPPDNGSCGTYYWIMSKGLNGDGSISQDFTWPGGRMYVNWEAITDSFLTRGRVFITHLETGAVATSPTFTNPGPDWLNYRWATDSQPAGQYRFSVDYASVAPVPALAIDNVGLRTGYWNNDCPPGDYHGSGQQGAQTTATAQASATPQPPGPGQSLIENCDYEQGWSGWAHNSASRLFYTGGVKGPTYAYLFTVYDNGSDPNSSDIAGNMWTPFNWPGTTSYGSTMYVSYWTGPGSRVRTAIRNHITGFVQQLQPGTYTQSYSGWIKHSFSFPAPTAGQYVFEASSPYGQIAALDGVAVAVGSFATGKCGGSANSPADNNATATAHASQTQIAGTAGPGATATANQQATDDAAAHATWVVWYHATQTAAAAQTQTQAPLATQTWEAARTQTQAARLTATAQGTNVPTVVPSATPRPATATATPQATLTPIPAATQTQIAVDVDATLTAIAQYIETALANAIATSDARATQTAAAAATQTAGPAQAQTQQAGLIATATAVAAATQTQAASNATAQGNATATAAAQGNATATAFAQATGTAAAQQTQFAQTAEPNANATATAQAHATTVAQQNATATAQAQAQATATAQAQMTAQAQASPEPVRDRPEPGPAQDCIRPSNPLALADWIDYEICRLLTWFAWSDANTQQLTLMLQLVLDYEPFGTFAELGAGLNELLAWVRAVDWLASGACQEYPLANLMTNASGILTGDFQIIETTAPYSYVCTWLIADVIGESVSNGMCFAINVLCVNGLMPWLQLFLNGALVFLLVMYFQRTWLQTATHG